MWFLILMAAAGSYLLGNLNGAVISSSLFSNDDVRTHGSGNAGLTNFIRCYGSRTALLVVLIDMGKAVLACLISGLLLVSYGYYTEGVALGALFVILGHIFPVLLGFKGGKGILSGVTVALMMDWRIGLFVFGIFLVAYFLTGYVSLGSVLSSGSFGFIYAWLHWNEGLFPILVALFLSMLIVWMHRANITRLIKGQERKTNLFGKGNNT
ncbi:MAG: glycerol-3-phosphate 1-O-acyltransferase PlsY [Ruminococcaceae bacterium]|nr:glycerol-3-phosphate 1-O-acyltransferase PlsY [Oscillospiraceae bacterium]